MKTIRVIAAVMMGLAVSACATTETATRNAPVEAQAIRPAPMSLNIKSVRVSVPKSLRVSEANLYYPGGDIVWREDPIGDRHAQVKKIVEAGINKGVKGLNKGSVPLVLDIQVTRFHALSEKARYTIGGVHALQFVMVLRNAKTGEAYGESQLVKADFKALGGQQAIVAEGQGITQKVRITEQLAKVIRTQLTDPKGYHAANLGIIGAINQM